MYFYTGIIAFTFTYNIISYTLMYFYMYTIQNVCNFSYHYDTRIIIIIIIIFYALTIIVVGDVAY